MAVTNGETVKVNHGEVLTVVLENVASATRDDVYVDCIIGDICFTPCADSELATIENGNTLIFAEGAVTSDVEIRASALLDITVDFGGGSVTTDFEDMFTVTNGIGTMVDEYAQVGFMIPLARAFVYEGHSLRSIVERDGKTYDMAVNSAPSFKFTKDMYLTYVWACTGLTHVAGTEANASNCTETGIKEHWLCTCGKTYADAEGEEEIVDLTAPIDPDAHDYPVTPNSCTNDGATHTEHYICTRDESHVKDIFGVTHTFVDGVCACEYECDHSGNTNEITDNNDGTHSFICSVCTSEVSHTDGECECYKKKIPVVTAPTANALTYNGKAQALVAAGYTTGGTLQYSLDNVSWSTQIPVGTEANTYTVYYKVVGDDIYEDVESNNVTVVIAKAPLTITAENKSACVNSKQPTLTYKVEGLFGEDSLTTTPVLSVVDVNMATVGNYTVTVSGAAADDSRYSITYVNGTLTVQEHLPAKDDGDCTTAVQCTECGTGMTVAKAAHDYTDNGFCKTEACNAYQAATVNTEHVFGDYYEDYYAIGNAGQLYWFAALVNGGETNVNAKLTGNITINENVLVNGKLNGDGSSFRQWTPIGNEDNMYTGIFDGNGFTISGMYINGTSDNQGLFGYVRSGGNVENVTVADSYIYGQNVVGGVVGFNYGSIVNCLNYGSVNGELKVGGVAGYSDGWLSYCVNGGNINGKFMYAGGVVGLNEGTVSSCFNEGIVNASYCVGGVVGYSSAGSVISCYSAGSVSGVLDFGGLVGYNDSGIVQHCYTAITTVDMIGGNNIENIESIENIENCYYLSDVETDSIEGTTAKTAAQFASGEVAYLLNTAGNGITYSFYQKLTGDEKDAFPTLNYADGTAVYQVFSAPNENGFCAFTGNYSNTVATSYQAAVKTSGKYDLNGDGIMDDVYEISNAGQLYWFAQYVNENTTIKYVGTAWEDLYFPSANAILLADIRVNENVLVNGMLNGDGSTFRLWSPIGGYGGKGLSDDSDGQIIYNSIFDGNGHTVSGLYANGEMYVGLVGFVGRDGVVKNVGIADSYINGKTTVGGVVGYNDGTIENCYNIGTVNGDGGVVGYGNGIVTNCYYLDTCGAGGSGTSKTTEQFASGEVAYLLGFAWGQTLSDENKDVYPVCRTESNAVYYGYISCAENAVKVYTNNSTASETRPAHSTTAVGDKEATCIAKAYCSVCDSEYGDEDPDNHIYGEWIVTKEATATEAGEQTRTCVCGHMETEVIPATGLSGGAIAGIVIGGGAVLGGGGFVIYWFVFKKKKRK